MATDRYSAIAEGIESGFRMGVKADELKEDRRARQVQETRQHASDMRAEEDLQLRKGREAREEKRALRLEKQGAADRALRVLSERQASIVDSERRRALAGQPVDPSMAKEYGDNAKRLEDIRQDALNYFSRMQAGQVDPSDADPDELYMRWTAATGMKPEELGKMSQHIEDIQAGLDTGNQGLLVQGVNGMMQPRLRKGVGQPSPHGGTIVRKEIVGLDPARDANGVDHPDRFIPRLRVYVKTDKGEMKYYDAPATRDGSTDPDDPVQSVRITDAMDFMGQMGTLAQTAQHPVIAEKLAQGAKTSGTAADRYLEELSTLRKPGKPKLKSEQVRQGNKITRIVTDENTGEEKSREEFGVGATPRQFAPKGAGGGAGASTVRLKLDELQRQYDEDINNAESDEEIAQLTEQYKTDRRAVLTSIKPSAKAPTNAEQNSAVRGAVNAAAAQLGLTYDAGLKGYYNGDGTPATAEQKTALGRAEEAAFTAVRDAAEKGKRTKGTDVVKEAKGAAGKKPKYTEGQTATNPKTGEKLVFKGGAWQRQ
jgi:hypothetical protein